MSQGRDRRAFLRAALGSAGLWALAGCGGGEDTAQSSSTAGFDNTSLVGTPKLPLSATTLAGIRARPESFLSAYSALGGSGSSAAAVVQSLLGASFGSLSDAGCMATFATLAAFECAPNGDSLFDPLPATMRDLLSSPWLACGHYCKLTTLLSLLGHPELIPPDAPAGTPAKPTVHVLVWLEQVPLHTGVHAQLIVANVLNEAYLLLDPTYAYALRIPFVGAGPQPGLTVVENATSMLQTPITADNLAVLDPAGTSAVPQMLSVITGGALGPQYVYHDALYGCEGWDARLSQIFDSMGLTALDLQAPQLPQR
jgi:hypothetical protein